MLRLATRPTTSRPPHVHTSCISSLTGRHQSAERCLGGPILHPIRAPSCAHNTLWLLTPNQPWSRNPMHAHTHTQGPRPRPVACKHPHRHESSVCASEGSHWKGGMGEKPRDMGEKREEPARVRAKEETRRRSPRQAAETSMRQEELGRSCRTRGKRKRREGEESLQHF